VATATVAIAGALLVTPSLTTTSIVRFPVRGEEAVLLYLTVFSTA
jgi:hypothetical protein